MTRVRVGGYAVSLDGYGAGPAQSLQHPLGVGGESLHEWAFDTRTIHRLFGTEGGRTGGPWPDDDWKGWWGPNPPYHTPVFVLTHYPRASIEMEGGTTFHFVTDGIQAALERALAAAGGKDVRIGGGASTIRQFLQARLIDEMHLAIVPVVLGRGESLLGGLDLIELGYRVTGRRTSETVLHVTISKLA
jgi:dihydrofolate reductase